jgi:hypothetical protein
LSWRSPPPQVRRDVVARLEEDQIARDQFPEGTALLRPSRITWALGPPSSFKGRQRRLGLGLLDDPHHGVERHDDQDRQGVDIFARRRDTKAATMRMTMRKFLNWSKRRAKKPGRGFSCSSL